MKAVFARGQLSEAATLYDANADEAPFEATLLRVRLYLKKGDDAAARALLRSNPPPRDKKLQALHALLNGTAHTMGGRYDVADEEFDFAQGIAAQLDDDELRSQVAYRRTLRSAMSGNLALAIRTIPGIGVAGSTNAAIDAAFAQEFVLGKQRQYVEQARVNAELLERLADSNEVEAKIYAVWNLAILSREIYLPHYLPIVQRTVESIEWPKDFTRQRFETLKALGWSYALHGDNFNAFRWLKYALLEAAQEQDTSVALARRCVAHLDRAYLARCNGEKIFERQELEEATSLAKEVRWPAIGGEERVALLLLAELFAPIDAGTATYYIAQYDALPKPVNKLQHFTDDPRLEHLANYSRAIVDLVCGHRKSGLQLLRKSYAFFEKIQYSWRAGRCALRLFEATADRVWLEHAQEMLRNYPASWLGAQLRQQTSLEPSLDMPPMQRKVFDGICKGLSNRDIAEMLDRSDFTVRNHVKELFKRFDVSSRSALIAEALRRKLL